MTAVGHFALTLELRKQPWVTFHNPFGTGGMNHERILGETIESRFRKREGHVDPLPRNGVKHTSAAQGFREKYLRRGSSAGAAGHVFVFGVSFREAPKYWAAATFQLAPNLP